MNAFQIAKGLDYDEGGRLVGAHFESTPAPEGAGDNRWLLAVDGSEHAQGAVAEFVKRAGLWNALSIDLIYVHPLQSKEASLQLPQHGWDATEAVRQLLDQAGLPWRLHVRMGGEPGPVIVGEAAALGCCGIVIGSRGRGAVQEMLMGSVAQAVLHSAPMSVWVGR